MSKRKTKKQRYAGRLNKIATRYSRMEDRTIRKILSMFKALRKDIADAIVHTENFEAFRLRALQQQINQLIDGFERELKQEIDGAFEFAVADGRDSVLEPLTELAETLPQELQSLIGTRPVLGQFKPVVSVMGGAFLGPLPSIANVAVDFSAELIQNIIEPMRSQINSVLRLAILGRLQPLEAMRRVTKILGVEARTGVWKKRRDPVKGIAARAETDVRTEMQRMYNLSHFSQMSTLDKAMPGLLKRWIATGDLRTRPSHLLIHMETKNKPIPVGKPFILRPKKGPNRGRRIRLMYPGDPEGPPEMTINCLHPDTVVEAPGLIGAMKSYYDGPMIELTLATGDKLSVTPNHPVSGLGAFVPAQFFREGDYVLCRPGLDWSGFGPQDINHGPAPVHEIFGSLPESVGLYPPGVEDFHGDGMRIKGQVHIKTPDRFLWRDALYAFGFQEAQECRFGRAHLAQSPLSGPGLAFELGFSSPLVPPGLVGRFDLLCALGRGHTRPLDRFRFALRSGAKPMFMQVSVEDLARYIQLFRQFINRFAGQVAIQPVVKVRNLDFRGHVYDLSTTSGYFFSGIIPQSNCRCKMAIIHPEIGVIGSSLDGRIGAELKRRGINYQRAGEALITGLSRRVAGGIHAKVTSRRT